MQVGRTKDQGLYHKPAAAVHPGALAAGTLPQYNTILGVQLCTLRNDVLQRNVLSIFIDLNPLYIRHIPLLLSIRNEIF